jgi:hypothetical protein
MATIAALLVTSAVLSAAWIPERARARSTATADLYVAFVLNGSAYLPGFSGRTYAVPGRTFRVGVQLLNNGPDATTGAVRLELPPGVRWESPTADAECAGDAIVRCAAAEPVPAPPPALTGFQWTLGTVVADAPGTYAFRVTAADSPDTDPDSTNNAVTINVSVPAGGSGGRGGGGGTAVTAGAVRLTPARPRAGATVAARVAVRAGGTAVRPAGVRCTASVGSTRLVGSGRAASGSATCVFRVPRSARGILRGSVAFTARGQRVTKRFSVRLG